MAFHEIDIFNSDGADHAELQVPCTSTPLIFIFDWFARFL